MTEPDESLYLVDSSIYIFRAYYSIPDNFNDENGESVNAVYGYTNFLLDLLEKEHVLVVPGTTFNVDYRNHFRITTLPDKDVLGEAFRRMERALVEYAENRSQEIA